MNIDQMQDDDDSRAEMRTSEEQHDAYMSREEENPRPAGTLRRANDLLTAIQTDTFLLRSWFKDNDIEAPEFVGRLLSNAQAARSHIDKAREAIQEVL